VGGGLEKELKGAKGGRRQLGWSDNFNVVKSEVRGKSTWKRGTGLQEVVRDED